MATNFGLKGLGGSWQDVITLLGNAEMVGSIKATNLLGTDFIGLSGKITEDPKTVGYLDNAAENHIDAKHTRTAEGKLAQWELSVHYKNKATPLDTSELYIGLAVGNSNILITGCEIKTSGSDWPTIKWTGLAVNGIEIQNPDTGEGRFYLPAMSVKGVKRAQRLGFTLAFTGTNALGDISGCTVSTSLKTSELPDDQGVVKAVSFAGAEIKVNADLEIKEGVPSVTWGHDLLETSPGDYDMGQAAWTSSKVSAETFLVEDKGSTSN